MRTNILRILLILVLAVVCLGVYLVGYGRGQKSAVYDRLVYDVEADLHFYRLAEAGDTNRLQSVFRFCVYRDADYYDRYFSGMTITNQPFLKDLDDARVIASQERTQAVALDPDTIMSQINENIRTNHMKNGTNSTPNSKITTIQISN